MLDLARSTIMESMIAPLSAALASVDEGVAMSWLIESGKGTLGKTGGDSNDRFAGFSQLRFGSPNVGRIVEELTISAGVATLSRTPRGTSTDRGVFNASGTALTSVGSAGAVDANTKYNITNKVLTVHTDLNTTKVKVQYEYDLTATEAALLYGRDYGQIDVSAARDIGLITSGIVFIDSYDAAINFNAAVSPVLKCAASGKVTVGGSGATINGHVVSVPTPSDPWLGIRFSV